MEIAHDHTHLFPSTRGKQRILIRAIKDRSYDDYWNSAPIPRSTDQLFPPGCPFAIGYTFVIRSLVRSEKTRLRRRARVMFYSQELDMGATALLKRINACSFFVECYRIEKIIDYRSVTDRSLVPRLF